METHVKEVIYDEISYLDRILHNLILRSKFVPDIGLLNGKIGIVIAFAHLYEYTHNEIYYDYMSELLDDVLEYVHKGLDMGFASGLSGIGWGIEYLLQNGFVEGDSIEICEDIDKKIMTFDLRRMNDISLENGLEGLLHYVLIHLCEKNIEKDSLPFDTMYFSDLYERIKILIHDNKKSSLAQLSSKYMEWYENRLILNYPLNIMQFVDAQVMEQGLLSNSPLGIKGGLAGLLLKQLFI